MFPLEIQYNKGKILEQIHGNKKAKEIRAKLRQSHLGQFCSFRIKREQRTCKCGCKKKFGCKITSKQRFIRGHNSKLKSPFKGKHHTQTSKDLLSISLKGRAVWNKGLTKETDKRVALYCKKGSKTIKEQFANGRIHPKPMLGKYGIQSGHWKGGITPLNKWIRSLPENKRWVERIFKRDKYTCQICKAKNCFLEAHHIIRFSILLREFLEKHILLKPNRGISILIKLAVKYKPFWNIKNGITLCTNCHNKTKVVKERGCYYSLPDNQRGYKSR